MDKGLIPPLRAFVPNYEPPWRPLQAMAAFAFPAILHSLHCSRIAANRVIG
jgi:hypothetical protein